MQRPRGSLRNPPSFRGLASILHYTFICAVIGSLTDVLTPSIPLWHRLRQKVLSAPKQDRSFTEGGAPALPPGRRVILILEFGCTIFNQFPPLGCWVLPSGVIVNTHGSCFPRLGRSYCFPLRAVQLPSASVWVYSTVSKH